MTGYDLTRAWYNHKFKDPKKVKAAHSDMFFYIVDLWNRLGQKKEFGLPTAVTMEALGIGSYNTYKKTLNCLFEFGFINLVCESKNQHVSKIIAISKIDKTTDEALDKAHNKAHNKATDEATDEATDSIDKQRTKNNKQRTKNNIDVRKSKFSSTLLPFLETYGKELLDDFYKYWTEPNKSNTKFRHELEKTWSLERRLETWAKNDKNFNNKKTSEDSEKNEKVKNKLAKHG